ncbi:MAG: peptidyl-prolyl cis-trans isomerase [Lentisphaeria bacterium]|nr:peptidyl-prolyl cis-trans isomerase [Lentisphaeria bacterium]
MTNVKFTTSKGDFTIELDDEKAPITVENFLSYVDSGFYSGLIFHRVMKDFMIQCGGMDADMNEKDTEPPIQNEAANGLKNDKGTVAMARLPDPHSASAQFFINHKDNDFLNFPGQDGFGYCVFGKVSDGMDVVNSIADVETGYVGSHGDVPTEPITIESAERV